VRGAVIATDTAIEKEQRSAGPTRRQIATAWAREVGMGGQEHEQVQVRKGGGYALGGSAARDVGNWGPLWVPW
jgi:hypothetical protein